MSKKITLNFGSSVAFTHCSYCDVMSCARNLEQVERVALKQFASELKSNNIFALLISLFNSILSVGGVLFFPPSLLCPVYGLREAELPKVWILRRFGALGELLGLQSILHLVASVLKKEKNAPKSGHTQKILLTIDAS